MNIHFIVALDRHHIVSMLGGEVHDDVGALKHLSKRFWHCDVALSPDTRVLLAPALVANDDVNALRLQVLDQACSDKSRSSQNGDFRHSTSTGRLLLLPANQ